MKESKTKSSLTGIILPVVLAIFYAPHCSAFRQFDLSPFPEEKRTLFVNNFNNSTFQADAGIEMTQLLIQETARRKNFIIQKTRNTAAIRLSGEITMYRKEGRMFDNFQAPVRFELVIGCKFRAEGGGVSVSREVVGSIDYSEREGFVEAEWSARRRLLMRLTREIATIVESEFLATHPAPKTP